MPIATITARATSCRERPYGKVVRGFYFGFDMLVEVAKQKFPGVDLSDLKAEDYTDKASGEVALPWLKRCLTQSMDGLCQRLWLRRSKPVEQSQFLWPSTHPYRF